MVITANIVIEKILKKDFKINIVDCLELPLIYNSFGIEEQIEFYWDQEQVLIKPYNMTFKIICRDKNEHNILEAIKEQKIYL